MTCGLVSVVDVLSTTVDTLSTVVLCSDTRSISTISTLVASGFVALILGFSKRKKSSRLFISHLHGMGYTYSISNFSSRNLVFGRRSWFDLKPYIASPVLPALGYHWRVSFSWMKSGMQIIFELFYLFSVCQVTCGYFSSESLLINGVKFELGIVYGMRSPVKQYYLMKGKSINSGLNRWFLDNLGAGTTRESCARL